LTSFSDLYCIAIYYVILGPTGIKQTDKINDLFMNNCTISDSIQALEIIPYTLAENSGINPIRMVTELRNRHSAGEFSAGINVKRGAITDMWAEHVVQPLLVNTSEIALATECVNMILKIDDLIPVR